ncbi:MAG: glycosyltransferase [Anaerolineales bacterium]
MAVDLSVIIPSLDNSVELEDCLLALREQSADFDFEVIVVDSGADNHIEEVIRQFPFVQLIRSGRRLVPGAARNLGVSRAASDRLAFLDADCIPSGNWLQQAYASMQEDHKIIGGPIHDLQNRGAIQWADNQLQFSSFRAGRGKGFVEHLPSCNLVMERATFQSLGGFHEDVPTGEDALLSSLSEQLHPRGIWFNPKLVITHRGRATLRSFVSHQSSLGYYRGLLQLAFTPAWDWLSRSPWLAGLALCRRFAYVAYNTWKYNRKDTLRFMLFSPILLFGLAAWTTGFYRGVARRRSGGHG